MAGMQFLPNVQNTTSGPDAYWMGFGNNTIQNLYNMMQKGATPYSGQLSAGLQPYQLAAGDYLNGMMGNAASQPYIAGATGAFNGAMGSAPNVYAQTFANGLSGISRYMNPYTQQVIDAQRVAGAQALGQNMNQIKDASAGAGAFGSSRQGVQEGSAAAQNAINQQQMAANLLNQNYQQATGQLGQDIQNNLQAQTLNQANANQQYNRMLQSGQGLAGLGQFQQGVQQQGLQNLLGYGQLQQNTANQGLQAQYQEFMRQQQYPLQLQQLLTQGLAAIPHGQFTSSQGIGSQSTGSSNGLMSGIGSGLSLLGTLGGLFGL